MYFELFSQVNNTSIDIIGRMNSFRENLRNELDFQGLTVKELSAKTGIVKGTLDIVIVNFLCHLYRATGYPDIWLNIILGVGCERVWG